MAQKLSPRVVASFLGVLAISYAVIARGVGNLYPFSIFEMYAKPSGSVTTRLGVRDSTGGVHDVSSYVDWHCSEPIVWEKFSCDVEPLRRVPNYLERAEINHVQSNISDVAKGEPVDLIQRVWRVSSEQSISVADCTLTKCNARMSSRTGSLLSRDAMPKSTNSRSGK